MTFGAVGAMQSAKAELTEEQPDFSVTDPDCGDAESEGLQRRQDTRPTDINYSAAPGGALCSYNSVSDWYC